MCQSIQSSVQSRLVLDRCVDQSNLFSQVVEIPLVYVDVVVKGFTRFLETLNARVLFFIRRRKHTLKALYPHMLKMVQLGPNADM